MSCKRWVKVLRFFALERLLDVTQNVYSELGTGNLGDAVDRLLCNI